jgi:hypothetical protein
MKSRPACRAGINVPAPAPKRILTGDALDTFAKNAQTILQT